MSARFAGIVVALVAVAGTIGAAPATAATDRDASPASSAFAPIVTAPVRSVAVPGAELGYRSAGRGRPLVLIPGYGFTMAEWDPELLAALSAGRRLVIFDNRAAGTSSGSVADLTIARMARDTAALIRSLSPRRRVDVLGWSMGSYIAQSLVLRHPGLVRRLVLASADPGGASAVPPRPWALRILTRPADPLDLLRVLFPAGKRHAGVAWLDRVGAAFSANHYQPGTAFTIPPATLTAQQRAIRSSWSGRGRGVLARLPSVRQRVLIAAGRRDVITPVGNVALLRRALRHREVSVYPNAGHGFLSQHPVRVGARIDRFLREPVPGRG